MAQRHGQLVRPHRRAARAATLAVAAAIVSGLLPILGLALESRIEAADAYLRHVTAFTLLQAALSTVLSVAFAIPVARAMARRQFRGRRLVLRLLTLPLALPAIVAILGIVDVYGNSGWLGGRFELYGLTGILLAHVFFNLPLAVRLLLVRLEAIPQETHRLAAQLGFGEREMFRVVEWPAIRTGLGGTASLVFLLCAASFAVVLTLGGGPAATTLEVAIYQSLRADFDPQRAALLSLIQLGICAALVIAVQRLSGRIEGWPALRPAQQRFDGRSLTAKIADGTAIAGAVLLVAPPIAALAFSGLANVVLTPALGRAAATSFAIGLASASLSLAFAWPIAQAAAREPRQTVISSFAPLGAFIVPPAVLATGWFIALRGLAGDPPVAVMLVILMNALMALPFVHSALAPAMRQAAQDYDRLCDSLQLAGLNRLRLVDLPVLRRPAGLAFLMGFLVSLGDLTAITLFGSQDLVTLPALIYRQMGSYRMDMAAGTAFVLAAACLVLVSIADRWSVRHDRA